MAVFSCGALPAGLVLLFFCFLFSCNIEAGAPGRHERVCCDVVRERGTVHSCLFFCGAFSAVFFLSVLSFFHLATSKKGNED